MDTANKKPAK